MSDFDELSLKVIEWAGEKGIIDKSNAAKQFEKTREEIDELQDEIDLLMSHHPTADLDKAKSEMGDVLVTLILTANFLDLDLVDCLDTAYIKIAKRNGEMINGKFVKEN